MIGEDTIPLTDALRLLPEGDYVHTFLGSVGCVCQKVHVQEAMAAAPEILKTGPIAQRMGHGMAIEQDNGHLLIRTTKRTDEEEARP